MREPPAMHEDVVVLVPGFLGFSLLGRFPYFADRVPATLAALLREKWGRDISVVPASTVPTGPLRARVDKLGRFLCRLETLGAKRFYLVGHSTGGVDAQLLMCTSPFWGGEWEQASVSARNKVRALVTISAPHHGTCLLGSKVAEFVDHPNLAGLGAVLKASGPLFSLAVRDVSQIRTILNVNTTQLPNVGHFVISVLRHHELLEELKPAAMAAVRLRASADARVPLTCFTTGADVQKGGSRESDSFYAELNAFGRDDLAVESKEVDDNVRRIAAASDALWIRNRKTPPLRVGRDTNDGIVNTARQLLAGAALGGLVAGDHADVLGDYDRVDVATGEAMNTGIFRSGAEFADDQFVELYRRVATALSA